MKKDFGLQLRQLAQGLSAHELEVRIRVVDEELDDEVIKRKLAKNLAAKPPLQRRPPKPAIRLTVAVRSSSTPAISSCAGPKNPPLTWPSASEKELPVTPMA